MIDPFSDRYWIDEFQVTQADLDRIGAHVRGTGQAHDLTGLARRVVRGRLRHGPEDSAPARSAWVEDASVRLWDPAGEWRVGDHAIVARRVPKTKMFEARVGEIIAVRPAKVKMELDGLERPVTYRKALPGSEDAQRWHTKVREVVEERRSVSDPEGHAEAVLLAHGQRMISQLLEALRGDERFVRLAGRWFLRELAVVPTEEQLAALAWAMVPLEEPRPTAELAPLVAPPLAEGDAGLFGLYLALRDRPEVFENADPGQRPRWQLAGPPPGPCTPRHAAYDPETYEVLCLPDQPVTSEVVGRLWEVDLLGAVL